MNTIPTKTLIAALVAATASLTNVNLATAQDKAPPPAEPAAAEPAPAPPPREAPNAAGASSPLDMSVGTVSPLGQKDEAQAEKLEEKEVAPSPFRGSIFIFDQSVTTATAHLEPTPQQTYVPVYEWWLSFRPRYYITDKLSIAARLDYTKEFTNSGETTKYREDVFGDIWLTAGYETPVPAISKYTKMSIGAQLKLPTSKESKANGTYLSAGGSAGIKQQVPLRGESASYLNDLRLGAGVLYSHAFTRYTTAYDDDVTVLRQTEDGRSFADHQIRSGFLTNHSVAVSATAALQITPKLSASLLMYMFYDFKYRGSTSPDVNLVGGQQVTVNQQSKPNDFNQATWFIASADYDLFDEVALGIGYYNRAAVLGPDSQYRNPLWSPDARVFFDVTANLDKILDRATGRKKNATKKSAEIQRRPGQATGL